MKYYIYTDGAVSNNGYENSKGGWAYIILKDNNEYISNYGKEDNTTNQRMELIAAIEGLKNIEIDKLNFEDEIIVKTDSAYLYNCWKNNWYSKWEINGWINSNKQRVANKELWEELIPFFKNSNVLFEKVKGHSGDYYNELVDKLAVRAKSED